MFTTLRRMKERILSIILSIMVVLTIMPVSTVRVVAETTSLPEAVGGVITLTEDVSLTAIETLTDVVELDLNGFTISANSLSNAAIINKGSLTIKNGTINVDNRAVDNYGTLVVLNAQLIASTAANPGISLYPWAIMNREGATVTIENSIVTGSYYAIQNEGNVVVNSGNLNADFSAVCNTNASSSLVVNGGTFNVGDGFEDDPSKTIANLGSVVVNGGTFNSNKIVLYNGDGASATLKDASFSSLADNYYSIINYGTLEINDGTTVSGNMGGVASYANAEVTINGGNFTATQYYAVWAEGNADVDINGGTFTSTNNVAVNNGSLADIDIKGGSFSSDVSAYMDNGYEYSVVDGKYVIEKQVIDLSGVEIDVYGGEVGATYDGSAHVAVTVSGLPTGVSVKYKYGETEYLDTAPQFKNVGTYDVSIKFSKEYLDDVVVVKTIKINKISSALSFDSPVSQATHTNEDLNLDFHVTGPTSITYSIENNAQDDSIDLSEVATIDENGLLTVKKGGAIIKVVATVADDPIYSNQTISQSVTLLESKTAGLVAFADEDDVDKYFEVNTSDSFLAQAVNIDNGGTIVYSLLSGNEDAFENGISYDTTNATISIVDNEKALAYIASKGGSITFEIKANITAYKKTEKGTNEEKTVYSNSSTSSTKKITYRIYNDAQALASFVSFEDENGNELNNNWSNNKIVVTANENYLVAKDIDNEFTSSITFDENDGDFAKNEKNVYVKHVDADPTKTGYLPVKTLNAGIDTVKSEIQGISYSEPVINYEGIRYYKDNLTITFTATDDASGVEKFVWSYTDNKDNELSLVNQEVNATLVGGVYTGEITLPVALANQLKGHIEVKAVDYAGNESDLRDESGNVVVRDSQNPTRSITIDAYSNFVDPLYYYQNDVNVVIKIQEANFYEDDVVTKVNGATLNANDYGYTWTATANQDEYQATLTFAEDGIYVVEVTYTDKSGNSMDTYQSQTIVVDKTNPIINSAYSNQELTITITETNFDASDVQLTVDAKDINGVAVTTSDLNAYVQDSANWTTEGNVHTLALKSTGEDKQLVDAIYNIQIDYADESLRDVSHVVDEFVIDHTKPSEPTITYSTSVKEELLELVTFGYYKAKLTLTITAYDLTSGIKEFVYSYTRQDGVSTSNQLKIDDTVVTAIQDETDKSKFTAEVQLPANEFDQLRGWFAVHANDNKDNASNKRQDDNHIVIFDNIAPNLTVELSDASYLDTDNNTNYYGLNTKTLEIDSAHVVATLTMEEINFEANEVVIKVNDSEINVGDYGYAWASTENQDEYQATLTFVEDGEYVINVEYQDKAENTKAEYTSNKLVVDNTKPTFELATSKAASNTIIEDEVVVKEYYDVDEELVLTLTIIENNFDKETFIAGAINPFTFDGLTITKDGNSYDYSEDLQWTSSTSPYTVTITLSEDGDYVINSKYTDLAGNTMNDYSSPIMTIDKTDPIIKVEYDVDVNGVKLEDRHYVGTYQDKYIKDDEGNYKNRDYFDDNRYALVTITEHNFDENIAYNLFAGIYVLGGFEGEPLLIRATDSSNNSIYDGEKWVYDYATIEHLSSVGDVHKYYFTFAGDANYTVNYLYEDQAGRINVFDDGEKDIYDNPVYKNSREDDLFTVDKTNPIINDEDVNKASYNLVDPIKVVGSYNYYNKRMRVDIYQFDAVAGIHEFKYRYIVADGVSTINKGSDDLNGVEAGEFISIEEYTEYDGELLLENDWENGVAHAHFYIPKEALDENNQFNGTILFYGIDRSGNYLQEEGSPVVYEGSQILVVDNIKPIGKVEHNTPTNQANEISYFDGSISYKLDITEANFDKDDVVVEVKKDEGGYAKVENVNWNDSSTDNHHGEFSINDDGDYFVRVTYTDKSNNTMEEYESKQLTIDTKIENPIITINGANGNGKAFKGIAQLGVEFNDQNFKDYKLTLTRTRINEKNVDVTDEFITKITTDKLGGKATFNDIEQIQENDGIYTATLTITDYAEHTATTVITFTLNRFGSVYSYSDYLLDLIKDGGQYVVSVDENLVITEYNADRLVEDSLKIEILKDGKPFENPRFTVSPTINPLVSVGESGWYQYTYIIDKSNFESDGVYRISISSQDETGNLPDIDNYEDLGIKFRKDATKPEITSIVGLEEAIINAGELTVRYSIFDAIGLEKVTVYADGVIISQIDEFDDLNDYKGTFKINETNSKQHIRIVVEDKAGNVIDTDGADFTAAYEFNNDVTLSTNIFVRFYANKPLFFGSISTVTVAGGAVAVVIRKRIRRKETLEKNKK